VREKAQSRWARFWGKAFRLALCRHNSGRRTRRLARRLPFPSKAWQDKAEHNGKE
jgi:hypothetical protein